MLKPQGYATIVEPDAQQEYDTHQCGHCQKIIFVKPGTGCTIYLIPTRVPGRFKEKPGAFCRVCMRPVCLPCDHIGSCTPFEQMLERSESRDRFLRSAGLL